MELELSSEVGFKLTGERQNGRALTWIENKAVRRGHKAGRLGTRILAWVKRVNELGPMLLE